MSSLPLYVWPFCYNPRSVFAVALIPVRGLIHFTIHPELWGNLLSVIVPQLALTLVIMLVLLSFFFSVQFLSGVAALCFGPLAPVVIVVNLLHQVDAIAQRLGLVFFYHRPLDSLFDYVYSADPRGLDDIRREKVGRVQKLERGVKIRASLLELPRVLVTWPTDKLTVILTVWMMTVPGIGALVTVFVEAPKKGRTIHERYFKLKGLTQRQMHVFNDDLWWHYYWLGLISGLLELVPFVSTLFVFTNRTGAALWAMDLEAPYRQ